MRLTIWLSKETPKRTWAQLDYVTSQARCEPPKNEKYLYAAVDNSTTVRSTQRRQSIRTITLSKWIQIYG